MCKGSKRQSVGFQYSISDGAAPSRGPHKKTVSFSDVNIRHYPMTLGDNPSCRSGPPVQIGWTYTEAPPVCMESFEQYRNNRKDMTLSVESRWEILESGAGCSTKQVLNAQMEIAKIRKKREQSLKATPAERVEKILSKARKMSRF
uniref:Uncharacterized protein n=1 Tax=Trieres chinensis TaxID=1514140 RepID=A0A7S1ZWS6_TRICV|mmetsp:Transcript_34560/g.70536  ORF Transcript_34560/g.70536 Transcript_34560/m.70536 type:complete len:146 (+) Transcript_34560:190-627(+)